MDQTVMNDIDPLNRVFEWLYGKEPDNLSQETIILRTIGFVGDPMKVDKNLAKSYLAAVVELEFDGKFDGMICNAAAEVFGIHFNSIDEVHIAVNFE